MILKKHYFGRTIISATLAVLMLIICISFPSCNTNEENDSRITVVCTIFPGYDWVRQITKGKEDIHIKLLLDNGADLHSYQPTAADIALIGSCDLFVYVGGESDRWVDGVLKSVPSETRKVIAMTSFSSLKAEEQVEGMQGNDECEEGEDEEETDEHVWLSLRNAQKIVQAINKSLCEIDPDNTATYKANTDAYCAKLSELDGQYTAVVNAAKRKTILFGDRFPFRYLADDYGLDYYAAFNGCSTEINASFETVAFLAKKTDENSLPVILVIETSDCKIANSIKQNTKKKNQQILVMNSCQSVSQTDINKGTDYLSIMTANLDVLRSALE